MLSSPIFNGLNYCQQEREVLIDDLRNVKNTNETYCNNLVAFLDKLNRIKEMEGVECESFYLNNYTSFRNDIEFHFAAYRFYKINIILFFDGYLDLKTQ